MISKLILGTVQLGLDYGINNRLGKPSLKKAFEILSLAFDNGITTLDTAEAYGNSQEVVGKFQKEYPNKKFKIITKLSASNHIDANDFISHISSTCKTLNTNQLYGYMFHNYNSFKDSTELYDKILLAKAKGLIEYAGISLYTNDEIKDILTNYSDFDFIQIPFNLLDNELKRKIIILEAKDKGIDIHTRSTFLQGLFFKTTEALPSNLQPLVPYLNALEDIKNKDSVNTETLALQYVLQKKYIDRVLIGVESIAQLNNNVNICNKLSNISHSLIDSINVYEEELLNPSNWE